MAYTEWNKKTSEFKKINVRALAGNFFLGLKKRTLKLPFEAGMKIIQAFNLLPAYEAMGSLDFELLAWDQGIGYYSGPFPLLAAYKAIK